ncbi:hypothetical protein L7F22_036432 [Adiantum nelumboides]|nr:hypothetical protein [Adiantum nelumboides]
MGTLAILVLVIANAAMKYAQGAEEEPLQDFCVADVNSVLPCKPAGEVKSSDFVSPLLRKPGNLNPALGLAVNIANAITFPGLNTLGLSMARIDFQPKGLNPPHVHPRASELLLLVQGTLKVGFVSTTGNTHFQQTLQQGDLFVFPRGLPHFQLNPDSCKTALAIAALNSQNPGDFQLAAALFGFPPPLFHEVLQTALGINDQEYLDHLNASVATTQLVL